MDYNKIKSLAEDKKINLSVIAEKIGMTVSGFYSSIKNNTLRIDALEKIAEVLEVDVKVFFGGEGKQESSEADKKSIDVLLLENEILRLENIIKDLRTYMFIGMLRIEKNEITTEQFLNDYKTYFDKIAQTKDMENLRFIMGLG